MRQTISFDELVNKVQQQEDTVVQLVKIIAATNHRVAELKVQQEKIVNKHSIKLISK